EGAVILRGGEREGRAREPRDPARRGANQALEGRVAAVRRAEDQRRAREARGDEQREERGAAAARGSAKPGAGEREHPAAAADAERIRPIKMPQTALSPLPEGCAQPPPTTSSSLPRGCQVQIRSILKRSSGRFPRVRASTSSGSNLSSWGAIRSSGGCQRRGS